MSHQHLVWLLERDPLQVVQKTMGYEVLGAVGWALSAGAIVVP